MSLQSFVKFILVFVLPVSFYSVVLLGRTFQSGKMKLYLHKLLEAFLFLLAVIHSYESIKQLVMWEMDWSGRFSKLSICCNYLGIFQMYWCLGPDLQKPWFNWPIMAWPLEFLNLSRRSWNAVEFENLCPKAFLDLFLLPFFPTVLALFSILWPLPPTYNCYIPQ